MDVPPVKALEDPFKLGHWVRRIPLQKLMFS
jgi:hypothetical protein